MAQAKLRPSRDEVVKLVDRVAEIVRRRTGNVISDTQLPMVEARLSRRCIELGRLTPAEYLEYVNKNNQEEEEKLVGLLTTHHTHFFREFIHFEILEKQLPDIVKSVKASGRNEITIWSAACSRGQEVYSLAMFLSKRLKAVAPGMKYKILGSDVDSDSVKISQNGVYNKREIKEVPMAFLEGAWSRGTGEIANYVKVRPALKENCEFVVANLLDFDKVLKGRKFDVIFCRNVFIYFQKNDVKSIFTNMLKHMHEHSVFFSGLSESLTQLNLNVRSLGPSVYTKALKEVPKAPEAAEKVVEKLKSVEKIQEWKMPSPIRVLAVDDSKTVHTLMKKIFGGDSDFKLVGHAMNGCEAEAFLKDNSVDVITLDIHMPEMDGLSYLEKNMSKSHPPVVMVSSANRDDAKTALRSLKLGASDFVEKPSLQNLQEVADELKNKLKMSLVYSSSGPSQVDQEFAKVPEVNNSQDSLRVVFADLSQIKSIKGVWKQLSGKQPATLLIPVSHEKFIDSFSDELKDMNNVIRAESWTKDFAYEPNTLAVMSKDEFAASIKEITSNRKSSFLFFGHPTDKILQTLNSLKNIQILIEEVPGLSDFACSVATDVFPSTSFAYVSSSFFSEDKK